MDAYIAAPSTLLSERELEAQIRLALSNKFTGLLHVTFLFGKKESIFAIHGNVRQVYVRNHRAPDLEWETPIARYGAGILTMEAMPARALMFRKIILEETVPARPPAASSAQLQPMFDISRTNPGPTLFHIQWKQAEGFVLVAGGRIPIRHAVLMTSEWTEEGNAAFNHIAEWEEAGCNVTTYRGDIRNQAWLELHMNIMLEWYCQNLLNRYQQLTGIVMVKSILQSLSVLAEIKGWNLSTRNQQFQDVSIFLSAAEAGTAFREVLTAIRSRIEPIIGSSLTQYLMKQSTEPTTGVYKTIQEIFGLVGDAS